MSTLLLVLAGVLVVWGHSIYQKPYVTCRHCDGASKRKYAPDGVHFGEDECAYCWSTNKRYRWELRWWYSL